ncbi:hypothetical protein Tco_0861383 [Tanacetum coccineum]|uniref:Uncharacterized protein n=1 Tax=Tanacetum coccineum TaxID=301880 RepID=A0ABQ5BL00_9ASTR
MIGGKPFNKEHKLNKYEHIEPIKQKKRGLAPERNESACKEVNELTKAGILREVKYQTWVANPVMVRFINMKLNPKKCSFGVEECPFLGHLITKQVFKANPSKVKAITNLKPPITLKEIQSLNGKVASLSRFLSNGADRSLLFFKALKSCTNKKTIH